MLLIFAEFRRSWEECSQCCHYTMQLLRRGWRHAWAQHRGVAELFHRVHSAAPLQTSSMFIYYYHKIKKKYVLVLTVCPWLLNVNFSFCYDICLCGCYYWRFKSKRLSGALKMLKLLMIANIQRKGNSIWETFQFS